MTKHFTVKLIWGKGREEEQKGRGRGGSTSEGDVREAVLGSNVDGVGDEAIEGLTNHGEIGGVLDKLEGGRRGVEGVLEEEVDGGPWEAPKPLNAEP